MKNFVFCSLLDFGIEIKGLWTSMDKTCMMTRKIAGKNIVNQANFKVMGPKNCYVEGTFFFLSYNNLILIDMCQCAFFSEVPKFPF